MPAAVALDIVLPEAKAIDIAISMTVAMAIDNTLADATAVVIVHPYHEKKKSKYSFFFCSRFGHGYCFVHSSGYGFG